MSRQVISFREQADALKARISLSDVVRGAGLHLKPSRKEWLGLCPFHDDTRASFSINDSKGVFLCRACSATGDHVSFVSRQQGLSPSDALTELCKQFAPDLIDTGRHSAASSDAAFEYRAGMAFIEAAGRFFQSQLAGSAAAAYLRQRAFTSDTVTHFRLGYAPGKYHLVQAIMQHLDSAWKSSIDNNTAERLAIATGLLSQSYRNPGRHFPFFRDRLIFPILDRHGRTAGFAGRILNDGTDKGPKYLNGCDSIWFRKSASAFNTVPPRHDEPAFVVEGYTDVMACHQLGYPAIATMGTAFNDTHAALVMQWAGQTIVAALDPDASGMRANVDVIDTLAGHIKDGQSLLRFAWPDHRDAGAWLDEGHGNELGALLGNPDAQEDAIAWRISQIEATAPRAPNAFQRRVYFEQQAQRWYDRLAERAPVTASVVRDHFRHPGLAPDPARNGDDGQSQWLFGDLQRLFHDPGLFRPVIDRLSHHMDLGEIEAMRRTLTVTPDRISPVLAVIVLSASCLNTMSLVDVSGWTVMTRLLSCGAPESLIIFWQSVVNAPTKKPDLMAGFDGESADMLLGLAAAQWRCRPLWQRAV